VLRRQLRWWGSSTSQPLLWKWQMTSNNNRWLIFSQVNKCKVLCYHMLDKVKAIIKCMIILLTLEISLWHQTIYLRQNLEKDLIQVHHSVNMSKKIPQPRLDLNQETSIMQEMEDFLSLFSKTKIDWQQPRTIIQSQEVRLQWLQIKLN